MYSKPINSAIKQRFQEIINVAETRANQTFNDLKEKASNLDHFDQLSIFFDEDKRLDKLIEENPHPYYYDTYVTESLLTQFANRTFLLNIDESDGLANAVFLAKYHRMVFHAIDDLTDRIPQFTYEMFIRGEESKYFERFKSYYTTDEENYNKIKNWRAKKLLQIVTYEYEMLIQDIQTSCKSLKHPLEFILSEKEKAEELLDQIQLEPSPIRERLSELTFLKGIDSSSFDDRLLVENLTLYRDQRLNWSAVNPRTVKKPLQLIKAGDRSVLSNELTLFYTIDKVASWMDDVFKGQPLQNIVKTPDWGEALAVIQKKAAKEVKRLTQIIEETAYDPNLIKDDIKDFLIKEFNVYRLKFNEFTEQHFFYDLKKENARWLKEMFATNCFFSNDIAGVSDRLFEAILIQKMIWVVVQIFADVFDTHKLGLIDDMAHFGIMGLLNQMVLDKELYNEFSVALSKSVEQHESYFLPYEVHSQNFKEDMHRSFHKAIEKLQLVLDDSEPSNKILYLQSRLKDLRQEELRMKKYDDEEPFTSRGNKYVSFFKEFLAIEADFIKETRDVSALPPLGQNKAILLKESSQTFNSLINEQNRSFIKELLEALSITVNGESVLTQRKKGAIRGVVDALQENNIGASLSKDLFTKIIATEIKLDLNSKLDFSNVSIEFQKKASQYIKSNK